MNWFGMLVAALQLCALVEALFHGNLQQAVIYAGFAVGSAGVAWR